MTRLAARCCAAALAVLTACATVPPLPESFALDYLSIGNHPAQPELPVRLGVARFDAVPFYDRRSLAWRNGEVRGYYTTGRWADLPNALLTEAVLEAARRHGAFAGVQRHPEAWGASPELVVHGRIEAFEEAAGATGREAHVAVRVALTDAAGAATYWEGLVEHREAVPGTGMSPLARGFRRAQAMVADAVVARARAVAREGALFRRVRETGAAPD